MSLTTQQQEDIRKVINGIWGSYVGDKIDVNDDVAKVVSNAVEELGRSSRLMFNELVSISTTFITAPFPFLVKFAVSIATKILAFLFNPMLVPVINQIAASYRSRLEMASLGI